MPDTPRHIRLTTSHPDIHRAGPPQGRAPGARGEVVKRPGRVRPALEAMDDAAVARLVGHELDRWKSDLKPLWDEWDRMWAKWHVEPVASDDPFLSRVQVPYGQYVVEVICPRILGETPTMTYLAVDQDTDDLVAVLNGKVASWQMRRMGFEYAARDFIRQALVTGYSVGKLGWIRQVDTHHVPFTERHPIDPDNPEAGSVEMSLSEPRRVVARNEPFFETVNLKDFVWPLTARTLDEAPAVWQRRWLTLGYLRQKEQEGVYQRIDEVVADGGSRWSEEYQPQFRPQGLHPTPPDPQQQGVETSDGLVEVWERWEDDRLSVIANRRVLIRDQRNPFDHCKKPFVDYSPIPRPFQLHGLGLLKIIDDSNEHLNTLMRQICDALTYTINPVFKASGDTDNFVMRPGAIWHTEDLDDIEPAAQPQVNLQQAMAVREAIMQDMQRTTGAFEYLAGEFYGGAHTATGISTIIQEGTKRIQEMVNVFSYRTMRRLGFQLERLNAQYLDASILVDFSDDPTAQEAWEQFADRELPKSGKATVDSSMLFASGRLEPIPQVGQDKTLSETQKKSDAVQVPQALAPILSSPGAGGLNVKALADWVMKEMGVSQEDRTKIGATPPIQAAQQMADAAPAGASGPSGPGGENLPTGGVVGAPGASGPSGPPQYGG
jgi:hypothetical protein